MGFFAVFKKNKNTGKFEFVDRWLNARSDSGWIERTIISMGWSPMDVAVVFYYASDLTMCGFDDDLNLIKYKKIQVASEVDGQMVDAVEVQENFAPQIWYKDGVLLKKYE